MKYFLFLFLLFFSSHAFSDSMRFPFVSVTDGDTIRSSIPIACPLCNVYIRIRGIDTPETNHLAKCARERSLGLEAKVYLQSLFKGHNSFMARNIRWDKYGGRILADVELNGQNVGALLIEKGYAKPYNGRGPKFDWCQ